MRIRRLEAAYGIQSELVRFPLHPETPPHGRPLSELYAARGLDPEAAWRRMAGIKGAEGLPHGSRAHIYKSALAREPGKWAAGERGGDVIHDALVRRAASAIPRS